jgi:hypothetical protein
MTEIPDKKVKQQNSIAADIQRYLEKGGAINVVEVGKQKLGEHTLRYNHRVNKDAS